MIRVPPPLFYLITFIVGLGLHAVTEDHVGGRPTTDWAGVALMVVGIALTGASAVMFVRARTTIIPHHRVSLLVTSGPYRLSRNPMYTGLALITIGLALTIDTWWPIVTLVLALVAIRLLVIGPEERYLAEAFGEEYAAYCPRVRRWL